MSQQILDIFWTKICLFQSVRANQSSISVKYAPKECRKKDIRRVYYLWIYRCLKQSTFHYQLTFICMYWALGEKWKAKELSEGVWWIFSRTCLLWRHNFPLRDDRKVLLRATQPITGWHTFWKSNVYTQLGPTHFHDTMQIVKSFQLMVCMALFK